MQIIEDPIGAVEVKVLTSQTHTYKLCRVFRSANLDSEVIIFNEILRVATSTNACELTE